MIRLITALLLLVSASPVFAQKMLKDINPFYNFSIANFTKVDSLIYFTTNSDLYGNELWRTDGKTEGTKLAADVYPGSMGSYPSQLTNVNGTLFFTADDGLNGYQLWKIDNNNNAVLVKVVNATPTFALAEFCNVNGTLFFLSFNQYGNPGIWRSDGTSDGTFNVTNLNGSLYEEFTNFNGLLFFAANDYSNGGIELWKSDGTAVGTTLVKDINTTSTIDSHPQNLTVFNNQLFFVANDGVNGNELWKTDGTNAGTTLVKDIFEGGYSSDPQDLVVAGNQLFFTAYNSVYGRELWVTDGTTAGTTLVKDIVAGPGNSNVSSLTSIGSSIVFNTNGPTGENSVWKSDGTSAGTVLLGDQVALTVSSVRNSDVYVAYEAIWKIDSCGLYKVSDFNAVAYLPTVIADSTLIFCGYAGSDGALYLYNFKKDPKIPLTQPVVSFKPHSTTLLLSNFAMGNQWYKDGAAITNAVADSLVFDGGSGSYTVKVSFGNCTSPMSAPLVVTAATEPADDSVDIYPNPFSQTLTVAPKREASIKIINALGVVLYSSTDADSRMKEIDTRALADGMYFVEVSDQSKTTFSKVIKCTK